MALAPLIGLLLNALLFLLLARILPGDRPLVTVVFAFIFGLISQILLTHLALHAQTSEVLVYLAYSTSNFLTYVSLGFGFFVFVNLNIASIRLRVLREILESGTQRVTIDTLLSLYDAKEMVQSRITRLVQGGHLVERKGRYYTGKLIFLIIARIMDFLKAAIIGKKRSSRLHLPQP